MIHRLKMIFIINRSLNYFLNFKKGRNWAHMYGIKIKSWHFVRKIHKKFVFVNLNTCFLLTLRLEISKNKGDRSNF